MTKGKIASISYLSDEFVRYLARVVLESVLVCVGARGQTAHRYEGDKPERRVSQRRCLDGIEHYPALSLSRLSSHGAPLSLSQEVVAAV